MARFVCIHGHFYQPPRENPWLEGLEAVEAESSAAPYHDWNERISAECYAPNAASRILDGSGCIARLVNNYALISFDFGPTLLSWLEAHQPAVYRAVLAADRESRERFSGHGSALAQPYNHMILPLASRRDKATQIRWGLYDFERRFGRPAEGAWLPETAVDSESLELLAALGVRFTILEPQQAASAVDTTRPYRLALPSGRGIAVFFYDAAISRAVAFERLLASGEAFAERLLAAFPAAGAGDQLVHVATDGETYGHHHRHGEMALSYALQRLASAGGASLTNYGEYLAAHPPEQEIEIVEASSWSCAHGVERWRDDCGCRTGGGPAWNQAWRAPLRTALDALRDELAPLYEAAAGEIFSSPWAARDAYIEVVLDRSPACVDAFLARQAGGRRLAGAERERALKLLELQRHAMLMYTSCGWFFSDLAGIETVQILRYAGRAVELAGELFASPGAAPGAPGDGPAPGNPGTAGPSDDHRNPFERDLLRRLAWARSNDPLAGSGRDLYLAAVRPAARTPA